MDIKSKLTRVAVASLTIGALAVAGFATAATAFADNGDGIAPADPGNEGGIQLPPGPTPIFPPQIIYFDPNTYYLNGVNPNAYYLNGVDPNSIYNANVVNPYTVVNPYVNPYYVAPTYTGQTYYTSLSSQQVRALWITATSEVIGTPVATINAELGQGRTLVQIAGERGWPSDYFATVLTTQFQSDVTNAVNNTSIDAATGSSLVASAPTQVANQINQIGF